MSWESISKLAQLTGVSTRTVRAKCAHLPSKLGPKNSITYESKVALKAIILPAKHDGTLDLSHERAKLAAAQTRRSELETARLKREVIPVREIEADLLFLAGTVVSHLSAMPGRLAEELADATHAGQVREILIREIRLTRQSLSEVIAKYACELAAEGEQTDDTPDGDSKVTKK